MDRASSRFRTLREFGRIVDRSRSDKLGPGNAYRVESSRQHVAVAGHQMAVIACILHPAFRVGDARVRCPADPYGSTSTYVDDPWSVGVVLDRPGYAANRHHGDRSGLRGDRRVDPSLLPRRHRGPRPRGAGWIRPQGFVGARTPTQAARTDVDFSFRVPDIQPGVYKLVVTGSTFRSTCAGPAGTDFAVLAAAGSGGGTDGSGRGGLAFTGSNVLLLVLAGMMSVIAGTVLRNRSRGPGSGPRSTVILDSANRVAQLRA